jgi:hypothetical protein
MTLAPVSAQVWAELAAAWVDLPLLCRVFGHDVREWAGVGPFSTWLEKVSVCRECGAVVEEKAA